MPQLLFHPSPCSMYTCMQDTNDNRSEYLVSCLAFPKSPSTFWHKTIDLFHSLFPWQLSLRDQRGFSGRQSAAVESLFTARLKLWYSLACFTASPLSPMSISNPHIRKYIITISMAILLVRLLTGHLEIQQLPRMKKEWNFPCCLRQVEWMLTSKTICYMLSRAPEGHSGISTSWLIRRDIPCANHCLLVQCSHNELRQAARPPFTGW